MQHRRTLLFQCFTSVPMLFMAFGTCLFFFLLWLPTAMHAQVEWKDRYVTLAGGDQQKPSIGRPDTSAYTTIVWEDYRSSEYDIYVQVIDNNQGLASWLPIDGVPVCTMAGDQRNPRAAYDQQGGVIITWEDYRAGSLLPDIYAHRVIVATGQLDPNWNPIPNGVPVRLGAGGPSLRPRIVGTNNGAYITWIDYRNDPTMTNGDIFVQYLLSANGTPAPGWNPAGQPVIVAPGDQRNAEIDLDYAAPNGVYIAWEDNQNGNYDIYVDNINSIGISNWPMPTLACGAVGNQTNVQIVGTRNSPNPGRGVILTWNDNRNLIDLDIYAQCVNLAGLPLWTPNGMAVSVLPGNQQNPRITLLENVPIQPASVIIAWEDFRNGTDYNIYSSLIDINLGTVVIIPPWVINGRAICLSQGDQVNICIDTYFDNITSTTKTIIGWEDYRPRFPGLYMQEISTVNWGFLWPMNGKAVTIASGGKFNPEVGQNVFVWEDGRKTTDKNIYAQKPGDECDLPTQMSWRDVYAKWTQTTDANNHRMVTDVNGNVFVIWEEDRDQTRVGSEIYIQKLDAVGVPLWMNDGVLVSNPNIITNKPSVCIDGNGGAIVVWQEQNNLAAAHLVSVGSVAWVVSIVNQPGTNLNPEIVEDDLGGAYVVWEEISNAMIWVAHISSIGVLTGPSLMSNGMQPAYQEPKIAKDGMGGCFGFYRQNFSWVVGHCFFNGNNVLALEHALWSYMQGTFAGGHDISYSRAPGLAWVTFSSIYPQAGDLSPEIYATEVQFLPFPVNAIVNTFGVGVVLRFTKNRLYNPSVFSLSPRVVSDEGYDPLRPGTGGLFVWNDYNTAIQPYPPYINAVVMFRLRANRTFPWYPNIILSEGNWNSTKPCLTRIDPENAIIAWEDDRESCGAFPKIYAQAVNYTDTNRITAPQWAANGKIVSQQKFAQWNPIIQKSFETPTAIENSATLYWLFSGRPKIHVAGTRLLLDGSLGKKTNSQIVQVDIKNEDARIKDVAHVTPRGVIHILEITNKKEVDHQENPILSFVGNSKNDALTLENYPNPFNPSTKIIFSVPEDNNVTVKIYDALMRVVIQLVDASLSKGKYTVTLDASELSGGIYYCKLTTGKSSLLKKILLVK